MEISKHIQNAIANIKSEEQREISLVKDRVMREKIIPFNQEIDKVKAESIAKLNELFEQEKAKLTGQFNENLVALQKKFESDKQIINETAEKKKADNANAVIATATYEITSRCEKAIAKLNSIEA